MLHDRFSRPVDWRPSVEFGQILTPVECPAGIAENGAFYAFAEDDCWAVYGGFASDLMPLETGFGNRADAEAALIRCGILSHLDAEMPVC